MAMAACMMFVNLNCVQPSLIEMERRKKQRRMEINVGSAFTRVWLFLFGNRIREIVHMVTKDGNYVVLKFKS